MKIVARKEIVKDKKIIGTQLALIQQSFFDMEMLQWYKDNEDESSYYEMYDQLHYPAIQLQSFSKIITTGCTSLDQFTQVLAPQLEKLLASIGVEELVVLSHIKLDLFGNRDNTYLPLQRAYANLEEIAGNTSFAEAIVAKRGELQELVDIFFWLTRCDPSIPEYIFFYDAAETVEFFICKYGNVHITEIGQERLTDEALQLLGWEVIDGPEYDPFEDDGKIAGREIRFPDEDE